MIFKRQVTLLKELIYSRKYNSVQHYAELFQVSTRTIHFDLDVLEDIVKEYHCRIVKKPGKGIFLDGKENDKINCCIVFRTIPVSPIFHLQKGKFKY